MPTHRLKQLFRRADIRDIRKVYFLIDRLLNSAPVPPVECVLTIAVPATDWEWFMERPAEFQAAYREGLESFIAHRRRACPWPPVQVDLCPGTAWRLSWELAEDVLAPRHDQGEVAAGYFVSPDRDDPSWIPWSHDVDPRVPGPAEQRGGAEELSAILGAMAAPGGARWRSGDTHMICGQKFWFVRPRSKRRQEGTP